MTTLTSPPSTSALPAISPADPDIKMQEPETNGTGAESTKKEEDEDEDPNKIPDNATETLYIQNLNENIKIGAIQQTLTNLFKHYAFLPPVVAHHSVRMRGQAFVSFQDKETANRARREVAGFPLYGKPMQLSFARENSDAYIKKYEEDRLEEHKKARLARKKITRKNNPLRQKAQAKLKSLAADASASGLPPPPTTTTRRAQLQMPDEYLPPNKVLFLQNLPEGTTKEDLVEVFEQHPNLVEVRLIPAKKDIAFVEYADEASSTAAKDALHNFKIDGETKMKVTFARK